MSKSITQDMAYRQSLMKYTEKYGVSRASRKYNKSRSYIYFWKQRWDGSVASLACQSRCPHSHPNQHTEAELKLIRDMRRRNPKLGMIELWHRLRQRGYTRCPESLFRIMRKMGMFPPEKPKKAYKPKPYEQMTYPGQRVQVDVKVVPRACVADPELRLFQYTAIDEFTRLRFLAAYPEQSTYSSADFLRKLRAWYARRGIQVECVQTDNGFEFTNRFSASKRNLPTLFEKTAAELSKAACRPQPSFQQLTHEASPLDVSRPGHCPICLTNLQIFPGLRKPPFFARSQRPGKAQTSVLCRAAWYYASFKICMNSSPVMVSFS